jgi:hypothetical protein
MCTKINEVRVLHDIWNRPDHMSDGSDFEVYRVYIMIEHFPIERGTGRRSHPIGGIIRRACGVTAKVMRRETAKCNQ